MPLPQTCATGERDRVDPPFRGGREQDDSHWHQPANKETLWHNRSEVSGGDSVR